jgi:hypothetical protein
MEENNQSRGLEASHYVIAIIVGLICGFFLQGADLPADNTIPFSLNAFIGYSLVATIGILLFMRLVKARE